MEGKKEGRENYEMMIKASAPWTLGDKQKCMTCYFYSKIDVSFGTHNAEY